MDHFDIPQETVVDEDRIYGRGLVNMKAAFPCYIEAVAALQRAGVKLKGDLIIAGVVTEVCVAPGKALSAASSARQT
jgi:acetylornithine deacetylase